MATSKLQVIIDMAYRGGAAVRQAERDIGKLDQSASKSNLSFGKLAVGVGAVTVALGAAAGAARVAWDTLKEGAALNTAANQFDALATSIGSVSDLMLGRLREATRGMVSDAQLMAGASQIISLGLAETEQDVIRLTTVIGGLGLDMQQVILTFANNSIMRLDALGLSVEGVQAKAKALEAQGFEGDAFDEAVLQSLEERWRMMGGAIDEAAMAMSRAEAAAANAGDALARGLATAFGDFLVTAQDSARAMDVINEAERRGMITTLEAIRLRAESSLTLDGQTDAVIELTRAIDALHAAEAAESAGSAARAQGRRNEAAAARQEAAAMRELAEALGTTVAAARAYNAITNIEVSGNYSGDDYEAFPTLAAKAVNESKRLGEALRATARGGFGSFRSAAQQAADAMQELSAATGGFFEQARQTDEINPAQMLYDMARAAGASAKELADLGVAGGLFSAEEAARDLNEAFLMQNAQQLGAMVANGMAPEEALAALMDMQGQLENNASLAQEFFAEVDGATAKAVMALDTDPAQTALDAFISSAEKRGITLPVYTTGGSRGGYQAPAPDATGARGLDFVVPPGYPNDSFMVGVQSGEHVEVTPRGKSRGAGMTVNQHFYNREAAAIGMMTVAQQRRAAILS